MLLFILMNGLGRISCLGGGAMCSQALSDSSLSPSFTTIIIIPEKRKLKLLWFSETMLPLNPLVYALSNSSFILELIVSSSHVEE